MTHQREIARVTLRQPITATACGERVRIVDASVRGVRVAHSNLLVDRDRCAIAFDWNGNEIEFVGRVRWTKLQRFGVGQSYQSGLEIAAIDSVSTAALRNLVESYVTRALDEQKANARGTPPPPDTLGPKRAAVFTRHELLNGIWLKTTTTDPRQPAAGFTVPADERPDQISLLRAAYAAADLSMRGVIRRFAELSIFDPDRTWPGRFIP
jgi:hypothetical protein